MHPNVSNPAAEPLRAPGDFFLLPPQCRPHTVPHFHLAWLALLDDHPLHQPSHPQQLVLALLAPCPLILGRQHSPLQRSHDQLLKLCAHQQLTRPPGPTVHPLGLDHLAQEPQPLFLSSAKAPVSDQFGFQPPLYGAARIAGKGWAWIGEDLALGCKCLALGVREEKVHQGKGAEVATAQ